jgi:hypothetical protein
MIDTFICNLSFPPLTLPFIYCLCFDRISYICYPFYNRASLLLI